MKGKLIVIEGTDCSGKETQTNLLLKRLNGEGLKVEKFSFPNYQSPTGKIVGINVILDRYVYSNMAHQGGKLSDSKDRLEMYDWLEKLEFDLLELPKADIKVFLHMPYEQAKILKQGREEAGDEHEQSVEHLKSAEAAYIELSNKYNFKTIECNIGNTIKSIEDINEELYSYVKNEIQD